VDRNAQRVARGEPVLPGADLPAGFLEHPLADGNHETNIFCSLKELEWRNQTLAGMVPADERLETNDTATVEADDGLIEKLELMVVEGSVKIAFQLQAVDSTFVGHGVVEFTA